MTRLHPGHPTHPMRPGAPLPFGDTGYSLAYRVDAEDVNEELTRARVELLYALARHRKAWSTFERYSKQRDSKEGKPGALASIDSDPTWTQCTNDVKWWRDEITSQASAILALESMRTVPREAAIAVFGWDTSGSQPPTERQYRSACSWRDQFENEGILVEVAQVEATNKLIATYEQTHPRPGANGGNQPTARQIVFDWDPDEMPTMMQYQAAKMWASAAGGNPAQDEGRVARIIDMYEAKPVNR